jgi:hypothetical protein
MDLAGLPAHLLRRPREWKALDPTVELLRGLLHSVA